MSEKFKYTGGLHNVGSYQVAGSPFVTASSISSGQEMRVEFPRVTNNVTVQLDSSTGATFNSIEISGTFDFKTQHKPFQAEGNSSNYSVSLWVSASGTGLGENGTLWSFGGNSRQIIREKVNNWQFITISEDGNTPVASQIVVPTGWHFLVAVASGSNPGGSGDIYSKFYLNNNIPVSNNIACPTDCTPDIDYTNGHFFIGPVAGDMFADSVKFRDVIVWEDALTDAQVTTLYNGGAYYDPTTFPVGKKVWVKADLRTQGSHEVPINHATANTFGINNHNGATDLVQISADSPFEAEEGSGTGQLRIHYRSSAALPNVVSNKHYWTLTDTCEKIKMNIKTKEIYLSAYDGDCDFSLHSDLTNIPVTRMYEHTGSGVDE